MTKLTGIKLVALTLVLLLVFTTAVEPQGFQRLILGDVKITGNLTVTGTSTLTGSTTNSNLTANTLVYSDSTKKITSFAAATSGQIPIGSTGAAPVLAVPAGTANQITVTAGAGSLTWSLPSTITAPGTINTTGNLSEAGNRVNTRLNTVIPWTVYMTGTVAASTTYGRWTIDSAVTIFRINVSCLTAGSGQTTGTQFQVTDGTTAITTTLTNAASGATTFIQNYAAAAILQVATGTSDGTAPANCNVVVTVTMQ